MFGVFGKSIIGLDHLTGPLSDTEEKSARLVQHQLLRGKPAVQDLANDAGTQTLTFFFDETFCEPDRELRRIERAWQTRLPMRLFADLIGLEVGVFLIKRLSIRRQKRRRDGKLARVELTVELIESSVSLGGGLPGLIGNALQNPLLRRG